MSSRASERKENFKGSDVKSGWDRRFEATAQLRKNARQDRASKKRMGYSTHIAEDGTSIVAPDFAPPNPADAPALNPNIGGEEIVSSQQRDEVVDYFRQLTLQLSNPDPEVQYSGASEFRRYLSLDKFPPINEVIRAGAVPAMINLLHNTQVPKVQFEICWSLTNIVSGTSEHAQYVVSQGAVHALMPLLHSASNDVREQSMWALGNLAGDCVELRDYLIEVDLQTPVLQEISRSIHDPRALSFVRTAAWTLSNLCRGKPTPSVQSVHRALACLAQFLNHYDIEVLTDSCWAFSYVSEGKGGHANAIIELGAVPRLVDLLMHAKPIVQTPALRVIGNIVTGDEGPTQAVLNAGALTPLHALLTHPKRAIVKEACWTLSNIMAGNVSQVQAVIDKGIIQSLLECTKNSQDLAVRKEASWAISNALMGGTDEQIMSIVQAGVIAPLCGMLETRDTKAIVVTLEAIKKVLQVAKKVYATADNAVAIDLEAYGGMESIDQLQYADDEVIAEIAREILFEYFNSDEDGDAAAEPDASGSQFNFGAPPSGSGGQYNFS
eukprot:ANDGO_02200.mRNA.1 Importin subunit alpha-1